MKKLTVLLLTALVFIPALRAQVTGADGTIIFNPENQTPVTINPDEAYPRGFTISLAGYELAFTGSDGHTEFPVKYNRHGKRRSKRYYNSRLGFFDFGFNGLTSVSYKNYRGTEYDYPFMDLKNGKSIYIAVNPFTTSAPITRDGTLGFTAGIGVVWRNYSFDNRVTINKVGGHIVPVDLSDLNGYKKSKLTTVAINVPVMLDINFTKNFFVSAGAYGGLVLGSHTKYKKPKTKDRSGNAIEMFEYGLTARAGFTHFYLFGNYGLNDLFKSGRGPSAQTFTVGFGIPF